MTALNAQTISGYEYGRVRTAAPLFLIGGNIFAFLLYFGKMTGLLELIQKIDNAFWHHGFVAHIMTEIVLPNMSGMIFHLGLKITICVLRQERQIITGSVAFMPYQYNIV